MYYCLVDTETTGLPPKSATSSLSKANLAPYPDLIEPAFAVWDTESKRFVAAMSTFTQWPGYTPFKGTFHAENNMAHADCVRWASETALLWWEEELLRTIRRCDAVVAYNAQFDYKVLAKYLPALRTEVPRVLCVSETMRILNGHRVALGRAYEYLHDGASSPYPAHFALSDVFTLGAVVEKLEAAGCELYEETFIPEREAHDT